MHSTKISFEVVVLQLRPHSPTTFQILQLLRLSETLPTDQNHWLRKHKKMSKHRPHHHAFLLR